MQAGAHARVAATATPCSRNGKNALINNIIHKNRKNVKKICTVTFFLLPLQQNYKM